MDDIKPPITMALAATVKPLARTLLMVELQITPTFEYEFTLIDVTMEDRETTNDKQKVLHHQSYILKRRYAGQTTTLNFIVRMHLPLPNQYIIQIYHNLLYPGHILEVPLTQLFLPELPQEEFYPLPAEPFNTQLLLPVTSLRNASYEALYQKQFKHFNYIQTQVFTVLYNSDDNVFLAAPNGSGKTICAEIAILRNHREGPMRVVYIAATKAIAQKRCRDWEKKFGGGLNLRISELTGETVTDLKLLEEGQIIITTPQVWDALSTHWKWRTYIQQVSLFIIDDLHFIGAGQEGSVLERVIVSTRDVITQLEKQIRIVALCTSVANGKELPLTAFSISPLLFVLFLLI